MLAGDESSADRRVDTGRRISTGDEDTLASLAAFAPFDGDPMSRVLRADPEDRWEESRPDLLQADETHPRHPRPVVEHGPEWLGQEVRQDLGVHAVIDQDSPVDDATDDGNPHREPFPTIVQSKSL